MIKLSPWLFLLFLSLHVTAQNISGIINAYTPVTAVKPCNNAVTVGSSAAFAVGDEAIIIQMKGATIDTTDSPTFGNILNYGDAGNYEFVHIASVNGNTISFADRLLNQYQPASIVQLVRVPQYVSPTVNALLTCQAWNGSTGGILALDVSGTLTLSANIDVSGLGFRGGAVSQNIASCNVQNYVLPISDGEAYKGEGIVVYANVNGARGKLANGGGGGNMQNAGGAGGAGYAAGGNGGDACQGCCGGAAGSGGIGGAALNYGLSHLFLGGGGGGGQQNQNNGTPGGNGGGIIIIKGGQIVATTAVTIASNGITAASISSGSSDGEGGGGSAGIIAMSVTGISGSTVTVNANGGNGGNNGAGADGPGGGGGGGGILLSNTSLQTAITTSESGGAAGYNSTTNSYQNAGPGLAGGVLSNLVLVAGNTPWQAIDTPVIASNSPVCAGQNIQFTVTGNYTSIDTFRWTGPNNFSSASRNPTISNTSSANTGTYTLTVNDSSGCSAPQATASIVVNPVYTGTVAVALCPATSYVLPNGTVVTTAGTYTTILQSVNNCDSTIVTNVSLAPVNVVATGTTSICPGDSAQLNATGGSNLGYTWAPSTGLSDSAIANPIAKPTVTTTYKVTSPVSFGNVIDNGDFSQGNVGFSSSYMYKTPPNTVEGQYWVGTSASTWNGGMTSCGDHTTGTGNMMIINGAVTANVSVWCETVTVLPNTTYDFSIWVSTLTATNPALLQFSINGNLVGPVFTAPATTCVWQQFYSTWNSGTNTTASICVVNQNTIAAGNDFAFDDISFAQVCDGIDSVTITVNPTYSNTVNTSICQGGTYTLPNGNAVNVSGNYIDTLQTVHGCDSIIATNLTVNPVPRISVFDTICMGSSFLLPSNTNINSGGVYVDTLITAAGCDSIITTNLYVTPPPVDTVLAAICQGGSYTRPSGISVTQAGIYIDTLITSGCDSVIITVLTVNPASATTVSDTICYGSVFTLPNGTTETAAATYHDTLNNVYGCDSVVTTILTVIKDSLSVNETDVLCNADSTGTVVAISIGGLAPYKYTLSENGNSIDSNTSGNFPNQPAGNYSVTVTDNFGCTATGNTIVNQPLPLQLTDTFADVTCYGAHNGTINFSITGGTGPYNFNLGGQTNTTGNFTDLDTGNFAYVITDAHSCLDTGRLTINQPQPVNISLSPDSVVINLGHSIQLNATSNYDPATNYQWGPDIGLSCVQCPNPIVSANNTLTYKITVTANIKGNDCDADTSLLVTVVPDYDLYIPNVFAPGINGPNNFFGVFGNLSAVQYFAIQIFDRWGERVYQSNDAYFQWDGTYKGKPLAQQVLSYTIQAIFEDGHNEKILKGTVTLLR